MRERVCMLQIARKIPYFRLSIAFLMVVSACSGDDKPKSDLIKRSQAGSAFDVISFSELMAPQRVLTLDGQSLNQFVAGYAGFKRSVAATQDNVNECQRQVGEQIRIVSTKTSLKVFGSVVIKNCAVSAGQMMTDYKYDILVQLDNCTGDDLSKYSGQPSYAVKDLQVACPGGSFVKAVKASAKLSFKSNNQDIQSDYTQITSLMTSEGKPCVATKGGDGSSVVSNCLGYDIIKYENVEVAGKKSDQTLAGSFIKYIMQDAKFSSGSRSYQGGSINFQVSNWRGDIKFSEAGKGSWTAENGKQSQNGTL
jgi:hypothetical protein